MNQCETSAFSSVAALPVRIFFLPVSWQDLAA